MQRGTGKEEKNEKEKWKIKKVFQDSSKFK
jgi:hypothetical protein